MPSTFRQVRRRYGVTRREISELAGLDDRTVKRWEQYMANDPRHPFPYAVKISKALAWFVTGIAIEQIEHNKNFITPEQRDRLLKALDAKEGEGSFY